MKISAETGATLGLKWHNYCQTPSDENAQAVVDALVEAGHPVTAAPRTWNVIIPPCPPEGTVVTDSDGDRWVVYADATLRLLRPNEVNESTRTTWVRFLTVYGPATEERS